MTPKESEYLKRTVAYVAAHPTVDRAKAYRDAMQESEEYSEANVILSLLSRAEPQTTRRRLNDAVTALVAGPVIAMGGVCYVWMLCRAGEWLVNAIRQ